MIFFRENFGCEMAMESKTLDDKAVIQIQKIENQEFVALTEKSDEKINLEAKVTPISNKPKPLAKGLSPFIDPMKNAMQNVNALLSKYDAFEEVDFDKMQADVARLYAEMNHHKKVKKTKTSQHCMMLLIRRCMKIFLFRTKQFSKT